MLNWYDRKVMIHYLQKWMRALLSLYNGFAPPTLKLKPEMKEVAYFHYGTKSVNINPTYYGRDPRTQYRISKALVTHELGHMLYTAHRKGVNRLLHAVHNILEDGRIDRLWSRTPGSLGRTIRYLYRILKQHALADTEPKANLLSPHPSVLLNACILANWRDHLGLSLDEIKVHPSNQTLWQERVLPLAREAWQVEQENAEEVWDIAAEIIRILGLRTISDLDASVLAILGRLESLEGEKEEDEGGAISSPVIVVAPESLNSEGEAEEAIDDEERKEIDGLPATNRDLNRPAPPAVGRWPDIESQPYQEFEDALQGPLQHVLHVLKPRPVPEDRSPSEDSGRPVPKNILFTPETPFEEVTEPVLPKRIPIEIRVIVDRSGSMSVPEKERAAILAALLIHLVCYKLKIEHEIVVTPGINVLANLKSGERGKALVAGIRGTIHTEDLNRTLRDQGAKLLKSRATTRVLYVIHDGYPDTPEACAATIKELRAKGIKVIGVGLELESCSESDPAKRCGACEACRMRYLFGEGLILATASDMHTQIASSLKSLRVFI